MKKEINEIKVNHQDILKEHLEKIKQIKYMIKENLRTLEDMQRESKVVSGIIEYNSKNNEFRKLPPKVQASLLTFCPEPMDRKNAYKLIGSIKPLTSTTYEKGYKSKHQMGSAIKRTVGYCRSHQHI